MKNMQPLIDKLKIALLREGTIVTISVDEWYSLKFKSNMKTYIVKIDTEKSMQNRKDLRTKKERIKKIQKKWKKRLNKKTELKRKIKRSLEGINLDLKFSGVRKIEKYSKLDVLEILRDIYKEILEEKKEKELMSNER